MKTTKRVLGLILSLAVLLSLFYIPITSNAAPIQAYQQGADYAGLATWAYSYYDDGYPFAEWGCGIMSISNAINYMTNGATWIPPVELATWACNSGYTTGTYGTNREYLYPNLEAAFGAKYGFKVVNTGTYDGVGNSTFINHIAGAGVAVAHVSGHYIAIVDYRSSDGRYFVLDSAAWYPTRQTSCAGDWMTYGQLSGNLAKLTVDWWCLISPRTVVQPDYDVNITCSANGQAGFNDAATSTHLTCKQGTHVYFRVKPNSGYVVSSVKIGGTAQSIKNNGAEAVYDYIQPAGNITIECKFDTPSYSVDLQPGTGGKGTFSNDYSNTHISVKEGTKVNFRFTPDDGYRFSSVKIDGVEQTINGNGLESQVWSFIAPTKNVVCTATFVACAKVSVGRDSIYNADSTRHLYNPASIPSTVDIGTIYTTNSAVASGWVASDRDIDAIGYQIGNGEIVYDANFLKTADSAVLSYAQSVYGSGAKANRFAVTFPTTNTADTTVKIIEKDVDGLTHVVWTIVYDKTQGSITSDKVFNFTDCDVTVSGLEAGAHKETWAAAGYPDSVGMATIGYNAAVFLGNMDLTLYDYVDITYATDRNFLAKPEGASYTGVIGLKYKNKSFGWNGQDFRKDGTIAYNFVSDASGSGNWAANERKMRIKLDTTYSGPVFMTSYNGSISDILLVSAIFHKKSTPTQPNIFAENSQNPVIPEFQEILEPEESTLHLNDIGSEFVSNLDWVRDYNGDKELEITREEAMYRYYDNATDATLIRAFGWIGCNDTIIDIGYRNDDSSSINFSKDYLITAEDAVVAASGNKESVYRFEITNIPLHAGENKIDLVVKIDDGTRHIIRSLIFNIDENVFVPDTIFLDEGTNVSTVADKYNGTVTKGNGVLNNGKAASGNILTIAGKSHKIIVKGDLDNDGLVEATDAITICKNIALGDTVYPVELKQDTNGDGTYDLQDAAYLLHHLFCKDQYQLAPFKLN